MRFLSSFLIGFLFFSFLFSGHAQSVIGDSYALQSMERAQDWFSARRYHRVQETVAPLTTNSDALIAEQALYLQLMSAVYLSQKNAVDLVDQFVQRFPSSIYATDIYFRLAGDYFNKGQYAAALPWFARVIPSQISSKDLMTYYFSYGYSLFAVKDYKGALPLLSKVTTDKTWGSQANYYLGYISYVGGDYALAKDVFTSSGPDKSQNQNGYFLADIYFKEGDFSKALETALDYLPLSSVKERSELNKIIGEAYFNLEKYELAIPYLEAYKGQRRRWSAEDFYQLGYSFYATQEYEKAQSYFNKITEGKDALSQNAYYYLGASYLKNHQKSAATNAFKQASVLAFDKDIAKDAALQYAKLSYEQGNPFEAIGEVLGDFIREYPQDPQTTQLKNLLLHAFLLEKNYQGALDLVAKMPDLANSAQQQDLALRAALEAMDREAYSKAANYLSYILKIDQQTDVAAQAYFWQAEVNMRAYDYPSALESLQKLEPHYKLLPKRLQQLRHYQKAYAFFKTKAYDKAVVEFRQFESIAQGGESLSFEYQETLVRLADAYYSMGDFKNALIYYNRTLNEVPKLKAYAAFNGAMAMGLMGLLDQKIERLKGFERISVSSRYYPKALLELGMAYAAQDEPSLAIESFDKLISLFPTSAEVPDAMLKKGLLFYNQSKSEEALAVFKQMGKAYKNSDAFSQARVSAKRIYLELDQVQAYRNWLAALDIPLPDNEELDQESYEQLQLKNVMAPLPEKIRRLETYLEDFPNGLHFVEITYDLATSYREAAQYKKALPLFEALVKMASPNAEAALMALVTIKLEQQLGGDPTEDLKKLRSMAQDPSHYTFALSNLMKLSYENKQFSDLVSYANEVLALEEVATPIRLDAQIMLARAAQAQGDYAKAMAAYSKLKEQASGALGAESLYWMAFYIQKSEDYTASNALVQELARDYAPYKEWAAKGLLLMAENFYAMEDLFQAHFIWQNMIDNFSQFPALVAQAKDRLAATQQDAQTPNSDEDEAL